MRYVYASVLGLSLLLLRPLNAEPGEEPLPEILFLSREDFDTSAPISFLGDYYEYSFKEGIVRGKGSVALSQKTTRISADEMILFLDDRVVEMTGHVRIERQGDVVTGERARYDLKSETGKLERAESHVAPWYLRAPRVEQAGPGQIELHEGSMTTCDLERPHYLLETRRTSVLLGERVVARGIVLSVRGIPILYLPYYSQPLEGESNIEVSAGHESNLGYYISTEYTFLDVEKISTAAHLDYYTESGLGTGLEGRLSLLDRGSGTFDLYYIEDHSDDNVDRHDPYDLVDDDRGKADVYYRQVLPHDWVGLLQLEAHSDPDILKDFFYDDFVRREQAESFINLTQTRPHRVLSATLRKRLDDFAEDVERLPQMDIDLLERTVGDSSFYYSLTGSTGWLESQPAEEHVFRNNLALTASRASYPLEWLSVIPFVGTTTTHYSEDKEGTPDQVRATVEGGVLFQSRFQRVYETSSSMFPSVRHVVVPTVTYRYRLEPNVEPEDLDFFDRVDLVDEQNAVQLEVRNYLQARKSDGKSVQLARHKTTVDFDFTGSTDKVSSLENELFVTLGRRWGLRATSLHVFTEGEESANVDVGLTFLQPGAWRTSLGYTYIDSELQDYDSDVNLAFASRLGKKWKVAAEYRYSLDDNELTLQEYRLWRDLHCWEVMITFRDREESTSIDFLVNLKAFPSRRIRRSFEPSEG